MTDFKNLKIDVAPDMRVVVLTGAGISAESGVPIYRGKGSMWEDRDARELAKKSGPPWNTRGTWEFYEWRRNRVSQCMPNIAHTSLVEMENYFNDFCVITQNIDGLHLRAGSRRVLELHGTMWKGCCPRDNEVVDLPTTPLESLPPYHLCGTALKPHVVQFGESLNPDILNAAFIASRHADLFFVIGTSGIVSPASQIPLAARDHGATVIEINPEFTPLTPFMTESIRSKATEVIPALWNHLQKKSK